MKYKFTLEDAYVSGWKGLNFSSYSEAADFDRASAGVFTVTSHHGKVKSLISDRIYYVLEGEGYFIINDENIPVSQTDVVIVPRNTIYDYYNQNGPMKLFLVHTPAYSFEAEVTFDDAQSHPLEEE